MIYLYIWVGIMIVAAISEVIMVKCYTIWASVGALLAAIMAVFGLPLWAQLLAFVIVLLVGILLLRKVVMKRFQKKFQDANTKLEEMNEEAPADVKTKETNAEAPLDTKTKETNVEAPADTKTKEMNAEALAEEMKK